ncbi:MAG: heme-dependent peroxidase [Planctomycetota bacterium]|nr:MAG: heme-dependent peroxidase [Planctomycetota bacterium]
MRPGQPAEQLPEPSIRLTTGWHCLHIYYRVNALALTMLSPQAVDVGCDELRELLNPQREGAPERLQVFAVSGHRADMGVMMMDPDPLKLDAVHQSLRASTLGVAFDATYSFVSISEISEYVPTIEQYSARLIHEGGKADDPAFMAKVKAYEQRLPMMNKQRLYPDVPEWPVICFYPMNKIRDPHANWYMLPFSERSRLMAEHATSGIKFAGKVSQLITASTGFDDWEWGVTLWGRTPEYIKEIVYTMRYDQASAKYAGFGEFYIGYTMSVGDLLKHLKLAK